MLVVCVMREANVLKAVLPAMKQYVLNVKRECISIRHLIVSYLVSILALLARTAALLVVLVV